MIANPAKGVVIMDRVLGAFVVMVIIILTVMIVTSEPSSSELEQFNYVTPGIQHERI